MSMTLKVDACRSCGAQIVWGVTEAGKAIPLDYPADRRLVMVGTRGYSSAKYPGAPDVRSMLAFVSHFATCPDAVAHRKPRGDERREA